MKISKLILYGNKPLMAVVCEAADTTLIKHLTFTHLKKNKNMSFIYIIWLTIIKIYFFYYCNQYFDLFSYIN